MFAATLLFCLHTAAATPQCGSLTDRNGPYETEVACQERIGEMQAHLDTMLRLRGFRGTVNQRPVCRKLVKESRV